MKVGILGSGNGATAAAFDWANAGHDVYVFDFEQFPKNIEAMNKNQGVYCEGQLEGFAKIKYAGFDIEKVVTDADLILAIGPAYSTEAFGKACKPHLKKGQVVIVCPSSCGGAIVFKNAAGLDIKSEDIIIAETSTLPYAARVTSPGKVKIFLKVKDGIFVAALPGRRTGKVMDLVKDVYPAMVPAKNVLQTTMQNGNPVIHPSVMLLNAAAIERTEGELYFYEEGVTPAVGKLMKGVDQERIALGKKLGVDIIPDPELGYRQGYMYNNTYDVGFSKSQGFKGIKAPKTLDDRYFNEDVGYGLVFMSELGKQIGVATPVIDSIICLASLIMERDYRKEKARTMESMGFGQYSLEELNQIL